MARIKFNKGKQKDFLKKVMENTNCPSLEELKNRLVGVSYSGLKNYFSERRNFPQDLFKDLCHFADLDSKNFSFEVLDENWGQVKGGKISKK